MWSERAVYDEAQTLFTYASRLYRDFHAHPEVAHKEQRTHKVIREELLALGIRFLAPADNITIALIEGAAVGATVGLRCDTDALPVREETDLPYRSQNEGVMHACGHDAHTAIGLCAARILHEHRDELSGVFKVVFQPAEEGENGAHEVIDTGLVADVDVFFAIHVWSPYASGTLHVSPIAVTAAVDMFAITVSGVGGHGATPEKCADPIVAASAMVCELQALISRAISPTEPAVLTIGSFQAGDVGNIIPDRAILKGTLRTVSGDTRRKLCERLEAVARNTAANHGCTANVAYSHGSEAVVNDERAAKLALSCAAAFAPECDIAPQRVMMLGDDFALYRSIAPICYVQVGIADAALGTDVPHHNGRFRMDERALPRCVAWMASFAAAAGAAWLEK